MGLPVTARTLSAAPPRASPSSLVSTTPSKSTCLRNSSAALTASWPVMASTTRSTLCGVADAHQRAHELRVHVQAAGGVDDRHVTVVARVLDPVAGDVDGVKYARDHGDVAIIDTAGRLHVDEELMGELVRIRDAVK